MRFSNFALIDFATFGLLRKRTALLQTARADLVR
jgi:hypothetical protein